MSILFLGLWTVVQCCRCCRVTCCLHLQGGMSERVSDPAHFNHKYGSRMYLRNVGNTAHVHSMQRPESKINITVFIIACIISSFKKNLRQMLKVVNFLANIAVAIFRVEVLGKGCWEPLNRSGRRK
jgi:hypothetical protein